ncbi:MAG: hypothetical protein QT00_C0001G0529 [archaeon GW2011_AR5]|nr:MAG: hypothetical protein QT00_C0001G0529 [archaeon GW2011_AR5]MBS3051203.1 hypothetical protein [Candidatus Aenigmarchaeota archaeon]
MSHRAGDFLSHAEARLRDFFQYLRGYDTIEVNARDYRMPFMTREQIEDSMRRAIGDIPGLQKTAEDMFMNQVNVPRISCDIHFPKKRFHAGRGQVTLELHEYKAWKRFMSGL